MQAEGANSVCTNWGFQMTIEQELIHWKNMVKLYKFDYLTGLKQRRDFEVETIHKMNGQEFWIAMYDVTGLHSINRTLGFDAGDALIKQVAHDIGCIDSSWETYRIGGDEFIGIFFDEPVQDIQNATGVWAHSSDFKCFGDMVTTLDRQLSDKKRKLGRRRTD